MDIVTHSLIGAVVASPFALGYPLEASCFLMGSVLPDADALSRVFGKRAFLRAHQTVSHSLPVIGLVSLAVGLLLGPWIGLVLGLGMLSHSLLDFSNTYGITLVWPFSWRRFCLEWIFFIDVVVITTTLVVLGVIAATWYQARSLDLLVAGYVLTLGIYWLAKGWLRHRAARICPVLSLSLIPSMLVPWHFLGLSRDKGHVLTFRVDALSGRINHQEEISILDEEYQDKLQELEEYRIMRQLSSAYHVVQAETGPEGTLVICRDLRTRNLNTRFGQLDVLFEPTGDTRIVQFHV
jgi:inner membrane protein